MGSIESGQFETGPAEIDPDEFLRELAAYRPHTPHEIAPLIPAPRSGEQIKAAELLAATHQFLRNSYPGFQQQAGA